MQARIAQEGGVLVVHLSGHIDVETAEPFHHACQSQLMNHKVVFDFSQLNFVGSSGLLPFLETLQDFSNANPSGFKLSGVGSEFKRLFGASPLASVEIYESHREAVHAYENPSPDATSENASIGGGVGMAAAVEAAPCLESSLSNSTGELNLHADPSDAGRADVN